MPAVAVRERPQFPPRRHAIAGSDSCIEVGLVNNMPDGALESTERQFLSLLDAASHHLPVRVNFFSLPGIPRSTAGRDHLEANSYRGLSDLPGARLDALIVTGCEPRHSDLRSEPYWADLVPLFDWVEQEGPPAIFSCLAAHAAVLYFDGIERQRRPQKTFGLFDHSVTDRHPLARTLSQPLRVAHSRWHAVDEAALVSRGYHILTSAPEAGAESFVRQGRNCLLFCQGHPEYAPDTLGREYQRDVRRFLARESEYYPSLPQGYFEPAEIALFDRFRERAQSYRDEALMAGFPAATRRREDRFSHPAAAGLFHAWLLQIARSKEEDRSRSRQGARAVASSFAS